MLGVTFNNLGELRKQGYHFIQNSEDDKMKILNSDRIMRIIELNEFGQLELINGSGCVIALAKSIEIGLNVVNGETTCTIKCEKI